MTLAEQTLVQVRIDKSLRDEAASIYDKLGLDIPTAIRMFFRRSIIERGLPFEATLPEEFVTRSEATQAFDELRAVAAPGITPDEIDDEISITRAVRKTRSCLS